MLLLEFADGQKPLEATHVTLRRALAEPASWRLVVSATSDTLGGERIQALADALARGPVLVRPTWSGNGSTELGPAGTIVSGRWKRGQLSHVSGDIEHLEIIANITRPEPAFDPFRPRWRVHRARNLRTLLGAFADLVRPTQGVNSVLERIEFPDAEKACVIQAGESDWTFAQMIMRQAVLLAGGSVSWDPLTLVGGVDPSGTEGQWVVTPGGKAAYEEWSAVEERKLPEPEDLKERLYFGTLSGATRIPEFPDGVYPTVVRHIAGRGFDAGKWKAWAQKDLPVFHWMDGSFVVNVEDTLFHTGTVSVLGWESELVSIPDGGSLPLAVDADPPEGHLSACVRPWLGRGVVQTHSAEGPWIEVRLHGFEDGANITNVRLTSAYSGKDGQTGLHLVPEKDTELLVAWSGRFDQSVMLADNVRFDAARMDSPSIWLDKDLLGRFEKINISEIGKVSIDSDFIAALKKRTTVHGEDEMQLKADQADLRLKGGIVRTGRAF